MGTNDQPILWHITVSHYSEKVRWALDYKAVAHLRRTPPPGFHMPVVYLLTRGRAVTLPVLQLDGRRIADSTSIIAALERRFPDPALYPPGPDDLRRALELEEWFDEELGPYMRRLAFYELRRDPELLSEVGERIVPELAGSMGRTLVPYTRLFTALRYRASDQQGAERARARILAALDRLETELGGQEYLVGGRFTVADLTAAALLDPLVLPAQGPSAIVRMPEPYESFRAPLLDRPACRWVTEIYRRHRLTANARAGASPGSERSRAVASMQS
jgi:glutathione S-transferase